MTLTFDNETYAKLLSELRPKVITTEAEYDVALKVAEVLIANKNLSLEQMAVLDLFARLLEEYEEEHYPMPKITPHEMIQHLMEARKLRQTDLVGVLGSKGVVSEVVNGKRTVSKAQAKVLGEFFHVSPALFI